MRFLLPLIVLLFCSGCFYTQLFIHDHVLSSTGVDKSVTDQPYRYVSTRGPDAVVLANERGVEGAVAFEAFHFPTFREWDELNILTKDGNELSRRAEKMIRDYFGRQRQVYVTVFVKVMPDYDRYSYLIDVRHPERNRTVGEVLVDAGLARVDPDMAKMADREVLLKLEDGARRSRKGIWKYASVNNPAYRD